MLLNDIKVPGKNLKVKGNLELRTEDIAGESSGTDSVEKGIKPKVLQVSLSLPYTQAQDLTRLIKVAEAVNSEGERTVYTITHKTANAAGIRQVRFIEHLNWEEADARQMWQLSFSVQEYLSNPERVENRGDNATPAQDASKHKQLIQQAERFNEAG